MKDNYEINDFKKSVNNSTVKGKNQQKVNYKSSKDIVRIICLTISGLFLVLSIILMVSSFTPSREISETLVSYSKSNNVNYRINLVDNDFYEKNYAGVGDLVPSAFVKDIDVDFSAILSASKTVAMNYSYDIIAEIVANSAEAGKSEEKGNAVVWSKQYILKQPISDASASGYSISDSIKVDYNFYNDYLNKYKLFAAIPIDATLNVTMRIKGTGSYEGKALDESSNITVSFPLSVSVIRTSAAGVGDEPKSLTNVSVIPGKTNIVLLVISIVIFALSGLSTILLLKRLKKMTEEHSLLLKLNKITRDYDQVVIDVESLPELNGLSEVKVSSFKDMIDIQKELHVPILHHKSEILENNTFYIINQNQVYKYILTGEMERI